MRFLLDGKILKVMLRVSEINSNRNIGRLNFFIDISLVHRVLNAWGPQTVDQFTLHRATMSGANQGNPSCSSVLDNRISTSERILAINRPVPKDVYERLKNIEDRILYLEGVSPEYKDFWVRI